MHACVCMWLSGWTAGNSQALLCNTDGVFVYACVCVWVYLCMRTCMCVWVYLCVYMCVCVCVWFLLLVFCFMVVVKLLWPTLVCEIQRKWSGNYVDLHISGSSFILSSAVAYIASDCLRLFSYCDMFVFFLLNILFIVIHVFYWLLFSFSESIKKLCTLWVCVGIVNKVLSIVHNRGCADC